MIKGEKRMSSLRIDFSNESDRNLQTISIQASSQEEELEMRRVAGILLTALKKDMEGKIQPTENLEILNSLTDEIGG
jgi:hypothetical protein